MKKLVVCLLSLCAFTAIFADDTKETPWVCLTGSFKPNGEIALISQIDPQIVVLDNGTLTSYNLKDPFGLYHPMYNRKDPLNLGLTVAFGLPAKYTVANQFVSVEWQIVATPDTKATLKVDLAKGTAEMETATADGSQQTEAKLSCTQSGVVGKPQAK